MPSGTYCPDDRVPLHFNPYKYNIKAGDDDRWGLSELDHYLNNRVLVVNLVPYE